MNNKIKHIPKKDRNSCTPWTLKDESFLQKHYGKLPIQEIAERLGRSCGSIRGKARKLLCTEKRAPVWSEEEITIMREHYASGKGAALVKTLLPHRTEKAIWAIAIKMRFVSVYTPWSSEESDILKKYYPTLGMAVLEKLPDKSIARMRRKVVELGLKYVGRRVWSEEEMRLLQGNIHLSATVLQQAFFPDRSWYSVHDAREKLKRELKALQKL